MGGLSSVVTSLGNVASAVGTVNSLASNVNTLVNNPQRQAVKNLESQQTLALSQLKAQQDQSLQDDANKTALEQEQLALQAQTDATNRQNALKRAVATQRADDGAQGLDAGDGSSEAVLLGMFGQSDQQQQESDQINNLRSAALDQNLAAQSSTDVLQLSQLQQKQNLNKAILESTTGY